jgi:hypothetical protein
MNVFQRQCGSVLTMDREREEDRGMGKGRPGYRKKRGYSSGRVKGCVI